ncbi:MAG: alpha-1,2-fucosyltransferase, partial [Sphingobacteriaceae bacterium]|nr:alpha-1,2-fucosyltransferase [Sphingobacteriaceae bacterium]
VALDISGFDDYQLHNGFELDRVFSLNTNKADYMLVDEIKKSVFSSSLWSKIYRKLKFYPYYIEQRDFNYNSRYGKFSGTQIKYLDGYWQSEKYFGVHANVIRDDFNFPDLDKVNKLCAPQIMQSNSVSLHVRMGDYVNHPLHGGICTLKYYQQAIELMKSKIEAPIFFIFSNDIEWCKQNLDIINAVYVTGNIGENSFRDMQLMSLCQHNIIANSSFSWWGAWLNNNRNKIVIAPKIWFNDESINTSDLLPDGWMKI